MSIRLKLLIGFSALIVISALGCLYAVHSASSLGRLAIEMYDKPLMTINFARSAQAHFLTARHDLAAAVALDVAGAENARDAAGDAYESFVGDLEVVAGRVKSSRSRQVLAEIKSGASAWWKAAGELSGGANADPSATARLTTLSERVMDKLDRLVEFESENGYSFRTVAEDRVTDARVINIAAGVVVMLAGLLTAVSLGRAISGPIRRMTRSMTQLAEGDLEVDVPSLDRRDEIGRMASAVQVFRDNAVKVEQMTADLEAREREARANVTKREAGEREAQEHLAKMRTMAAELEAREKEAQDQVERISRSVAKFGAIFEAMARGDLKLRADGDLDASFRRLGADTNAMADKLTEIVDRIHGASSTISAAVTQVATGSGELSNRTEQQASTIEETSASMEQLSSTVRQNADNAQQANQLAAKAREVAVKGGEVVTETVEAMGRIEDSSKKVADIMGVIDDIAFQTNLLSLNASVEAARAGDVGKGFAVVASEVRSLAQRAAESSKEIQALITESGTQVRIGVELVNRTGGTLEEIMASIKSTADIVAEIAAASREQSQGLEEVNVAMAQMDDMTQRNAAMVQEFAAASQSMRDEVARLADLMTFFDTGKQPQIAAPPAPHPAEVDAEPADDGQSPADPPDNPNPVSEIVDRAEQRFQPISRAANGQDQEWEVF